MRQRRVLALLTVSGFAGLAYEVLWVRLLASSFGSTTLSFSTILAVFFGGLALGARLAGPRARSLEDPLRTYGLIEATIGVCALALYPVLTHLPTLFAAIDPGPGLGGALVRLTVALPILLLPTVLMGATLPVVMAGIVERDDDVGRGSALIYGFNTLGACLGAYTVTFWLLPSLGVWRSTLVAVALNLAIAAAILLAQRSPGPSPASTPESAPAPHAAGLRVAGGLALISGLAAILLQVVWVRAFSIVLNGSVYAVGSVLIVVLLGIAIGSIAIAGRIRASVQSASALATWFVALQLVSIVSLLALFAALPRLAFELQSLATAARGMTTIHAQLGVVFFALLVPTSATGASFPLLLALAERRAAVAPNALGRLYAVNTVGSIAGSLLGGFVLIPAVGTEWVAGIAIGLLAVNAVIAALALGGGSRAPRLAIAAAGVAGLGTYDGFEVQLLAHKSVGADWQQHRAGARARAGGLVFFEETHSVTVSVLQMGPDRSLRLNGLAQGRYSQVPPHYSVEAVLIALAPLIHHPDPERGLLVGLGAGVTLDVLVELGVPELRVIELEGAVAEAARIIFGDRSPVDAPSVDLVIDDARQHLLLGATRGEPKWDFITSMPAHPWVAPNIFTREFFTIASANLSETGVFCTWLGGDVFGTRIDSASAHSVLRAFAGSFDYWAAYFVPELASYYLVGSAAPLRVHPAATARLGQRPVLRGLGQLSDPMFFPRHRIAAGWPEAPPLAAGPVNTDDSAYVETHAPLAGGRSRRTNTADPELVGRPLWTPLMVDEHHRETFFIELVEELLGSPLGEPRWNPDPTAARQVVRDVAAVFTDSERAYFEARARLAEGDVDAAGRLRDLAEATTGTEPLDDVLRQRARRFADAGDAAAKHSLPQ